jgi:chromosome segregation ATPase
MAAQEEKKSEPYNELNSLKGDAEEYGEAINIHQANLDQARAAVQQAEQQVIANQGAQQAIQRRIERLEEQAAETK